MNLYNEKIIGLLTICTRAANVVYGFNSVKECILTRKAKLVLLSADISAKTEKEIRFFAAKTDVHVIKTGITIEEMEFRTGKRSAAAAVCDKGIAARLLELAEHTASESDK